VAENYKDCPFIRYKNIAGRFFGLVTKHTYDRRTDGQNYDSQDRASIAASRGKNSKANTVPRSNIDYSRKYYSKLRHASHP